MSAKPVLIDSKAKIKLPSSLCSCMECESTSCFKIRYNSSTQCSCNKCKNSKTCLFYSKTVLKDNLSDVKDNKTDKSDNKFDSNSNPMNKIKSVSQNQGLNRNMPSVNKGFKNEHSENGSLYELDYIIERNLIQKQPGHSPKMSNAKIDGTVAQNIPSNSGISSSTAKLSAQIMNVPYKDFKKSISFSKSKSSVAKMTKYDILQRIKDAYDACSCKVCECIANISPTPTATEVCNCRPCDCNDCRKFKTKLSDTKYMTNIDKLVTSGELQKRCKCQPCECIECDKDAAACDCKPCQCLECKSMLNKRKMKTIIVAPVEDNHPRYCQCNPCACFECAHVFGHIVTTNTHEISTDIRRHPNCRCDLCLNEACEREGVDACRCEQHNKIMKKPVQRSTHDYDIRRAKVTRDRINTNTTTQQAEQIVNTTTAMLAALPQSYPRTEHHCACDVFQCVECECKDEIANSFKSPQDYGLMQNLHKLPYKSNSCKCSPCECEICTNGEIVQRKRNCKCDVCDCILCANLKKSSFSNENVMKPFNTLFCKGMCSCEPCECIACQSKYGYNNNTSWVNSRQYMCQDKISEIVHPIKKGKLLNYSASKTDDVDRNNDSFKDCDNKSASPYSQFSFKNNSEDFLIYHAFPRYQNSYQDFPVINSMTNPIILQSPRNSNEKDIDAVNRKKSTSTTKSYTNLEIKNQENVPLSFTNKEAYCQASGSYMSALSTCATLSRMSYVNESGSASPSSIRKYNKSGESSCNSSGHDHSDYLIRFPRKTVETCINDVMKLNLDRKVNLNRLNVQSKANSKNVSGPHTPSYPSDQQRIPCRKRRVIESNNPIPPEHTYNPNVCKIWNDENTCESEQCFCDKCSSKKLKLNKCRCYCKSCNCCGMCLTEDLSIFIRKNECTQTHKQIFLDRSQDGTDETKVNSVVDSVSKRIHQLDSMLLHSTELEVSKEEVNLMQKLFLKALNSSFSNRNITNNYVNDNFCPWRYGQHSINSCKNNNIDLFNINIYESVHRTIREARAFSLELMQILETYEKANRDFESVSQKLKESHKSIMEGYNCSNGDLNIENKREDTITNSKVNLFVEINFKPGGDKYEYDSKIKNKEAVYTESSKNSIKRDLNNTIAKTEQVIQPKNHTNSIKILTSNENEIAPELGTSSTFISMSKDLQKSSEYSEKRITNKIYNFGAKKKIESNTLQQNILDLIEDLLKNMIVDPNKKREGKKSFKEYKKLIKRAAVTARRNSTSNKITTFELSESSNIKSQKIENKKLHCLSMTVKQLKEINDQLECEQRNNERDVCNNGLISLLSPVSGSIDLTLGRNLIQMSEEMKILSKKNRPIEAEAMSFSKKENDVTTLPFLEFSVKAPMKPVLQETTRIEANKMVAVPYQNKALANLLTEVKDLYDMPMLHRQLIYNDNKSEKNESISNNAFDTSSASVSQTQIKKRNDAYNMGLPQDKHTIFLDRPSIKSTVTDSNIGSHSPSVASRSSDDMKVQFQTVRRVSDHTILVKWNAPRAVTHVQGYELLVDGRAVKKILNPTSCMAVVTCLPHSDKVLLTVRTISSIKGQSRLPSSTIVYRPRVKKTLSSSP